MSALCGLVDFRNSPSNPQDLRQVIARMIERCQQRGTARTARDFRASHFIAEHNWAFGFHDLYSTSDPSREDSQEHHSQRPQPCRDESGRYVLVFDGRLDHREAALDALHAAHAQLRNDSDAEVVLQGYLQWGDRWWQSLVGPFALVIWDALNKTLLCARDFSAQRPLFFSLRNQQLAVASSFVQLLEAPWVRREPDEGFIAEYLTGTVATPEHTVWRDIACVDAGSVVRINASGIRRQRYFRPDEAPALPHHGDEAYAARLRDLLQASVRGALRTHTPVGLELSGGVDSSTVVGVAMHLAQQAPTDYPPMAAFSYTFPGYACDEQAYIAQVSTRWPALTLHAVAWSASRVADYTQSLLDDAAAEQGLADYPNAMIHDVAALALRTEHTVMVAGVGGDECFQGPRAASFKLRLKRAIARRIPRRRFAWVAPEFAARTQLHDRIFQPSPWARYAREDQMHIIDALASPWVVATRDLVHRSRVLRGIDYRAPLLDRRLVEFALALPASQSVRHGTHKFVLRNAARHWLPEGVASRDDKSEFSHFFVEALRHVFPRGPLRLPRLEQLGWIRTDPLQAWQREIHAVDARSGPFPHDKLWTLWMMYAIEHWLKQL